jgi:protein angel
MPRSYRYWHPTQFGDRYFENVKGMAGTPFILMSYNILAQDLLDGHNYLYAQHDQTALDWSHRYRILMREILSLQPQILCLQEVQDSHLNAIYEGLKSLKLKYVFKKRTGFKSDGCAIFYNSEMFDLIEQETVEYYQPGVKVSEI